MQLLITPQTLARVLVGLLGRAKACGEQLECEDEASTCTVSIELSRIVKKSAFCRSDPLSCSNDFSFRPHLASVNRNRSDIIDFDF